MVEKLRSVLSQLHDLQQIVTMCVYINLSENTSRDESKRTIRNKIAHVTLKFY